MSKPKMLLIAYRAWGDHLFWSPLIPYLTEKYDVYLETNSKGYTLFYDDPRFKKVAVFTDYEGKDRSTFADLFRQRWEKIREQIKPDIELNLNGTLEVSCIAERFQDEFWFPVGKRRALFGCHNFYDSVFERAGMPVPPGLNLQGLYYTPEQTEKIEQWRTKLKDNFVVIIPIAGSSAQKVFHLYDKVTEAILAKYPDAIVYQAGDEACRKLFTNHVRVRSMIGDDVTIKQAIHMVGYADMVIGPETCLLAAAGMWGTPQVQLATSTSIYQLTKYQINNFSIQAPISCSPCHRAIYYEGDCENELKDKDGKFVATACTQMFRLEDIMERVDYVYKNLRYSERSLNK